MCNDQHDPVCVALQVLKNRLVIGIWFAVFLWYSTLLLIEPNTLTAVFHVASNPFNGFDTQSPVWMRYQFPQGCPGNNHTLLYNESVGLGSWRHQLPNNCAMIDASARKCGQACVERQMGGKPTAGMPFELRCFIWVVSLPSHVSLA